MHGLPAAEEIVDAVIRSVGKRQGKVKVIYIEMGPDSTIDAEELDLCFNIASNGTVIEDSDIRITLKPGQVECLDCGHNELKERVDRIPTCSSCISTNIKVNGCGIVLKNIAFEEEEQ